MAAGKKPVDLTRHFDGDAAGGLISTTGDVNRFLRALAGGKLLSPAMLEQMRATVPATPFEEAWPGVRYGLGVMSRPCRAAASTGATAATTPDTRPAPASPPTAAQRRAGGVLAVRRRPHAGSGEGRHRPGRPRALREVSGVTPPGRTADGTGPRGRAARPYG
nr:hypothetical protein GCM10020093_003750 [Planobispora longispora]